MIWFCYETSLFGTRTSNKIIMKSKITHLIISLIFAVTLGYMASISTIMIIPIIGYILTAMAQIMNYNFDITIRILCWVYTVIISYYLWTKTK